MKVYYLCTNGGKWMDEKLQELLQSLIQKIFNEEVFDDINSLQEKLYALEEWQCEAIEKGEQRSLIEIKRVLDLVSKNFMPEQEKSFYLGMICAYSNILGLLIRSSSDHYKELPDLEKKILLYVWCNPETTNSEITNHFNLNKNHTSNYLTKLLHKKLVNVFQTGRNRYYSATPKGVKVAKQFDLTVKKKKNKDETDSVFNRESSWRDWNEVMIANPQLKSSFESNPYWGHSQIHIGPSLEKQYPEDLQEYQMAIKKEMDKFLTEGDTAKIAIFNQISNSYLVEIMQVDEYGNEKLKIFGDDISERQLNRLPLYK